MPDADSLIVERAVLDFEEGLAHARDRLKQGHGRIVGATLDGIVMTAVNMLHVRDQMRDDVRFLLSLAHRVAQGEDPEQLATQNLERVLRLKQKMHFLVQEDDPNFQRVLSIARENFAKRLPDLARMASVTDPEHYEDLVRKAFPDAKHVEDIVVENRDFTLRIVEILEQHPHVLRVPRALVPKIAATARDVVHWQTERVLAAVADIYAHEQRA